MIAPISSGVPRCWNGSIGIARQEPAGDRGKAAIWQIRTAGNALSRHFAATNTKILVNCGGGVDADGNLRVLSGMMLPLIPAPYYGTAI
jgi:hypothetical protein